MTTTRHRTLMLAALLVTASVAWRAGRARADGVPTAPGALTYGGTLDDGAGRPVEGARSITVRLWDAATGGTAVCATAAPSSPVVAGRFHVALDATCAAAVRANPDLWVEVTVDATTFPRSRIAAVPYALEAGRAAAASGALAARLAAAEAAARPRQVEIGGAGPASPVCAADWRPTPALAPLAVTAAATAVYRVSARLHVNAARSVVSYAYLRITAAGATFLAQPETRVVRDATAADVVAYVRLAAGATYTFTLDARTSSTPSTCDFGVEGAMPLVVEQVN